MEKSKDTIIAWLRLARVTGPIQGARLLEEFGGVEAVFEAGKNELRGVEGVRRPVIDSVLDPSHLEAAGRDYDTCGEAGIELISLDDPSYPGPLRQISDPPLVLFVRGTAAEEEEEGVAVVGCRNPDAYGESMATSLGAGLARHGFTVVSGLARGVDGIAQKAALKAGGRTISVLGTGADVVYPPEHKKLFETVVENGAVVSELPPGTGPDARHFPRRNRIISGLSRGVIMVQALSERSGALITVRHALEQGREVYAVPGNAGSRAGHAGNLLIKQGAKLVESAEDVVLDLRPLGAVDISPSEEKEGSGRRRIELPDTQASIYALVPSPAEGTIDIDALSRQAGVPVGETLTALLELELSGLVRALPGKRYVRITEA
jgi:DNA processing protein